MGKSWRRAGASFPDHAVEVEKLQDVLQGAGPSSFLINVSHVSLVGNRHVTTKCFFVALIESFLKEEAALQHFCEWVTCHWHLSLVVVVGGESCWR